MSNSYDPVPPSLSQVNLSRLCAEGPNPDPPVGEQVVLLGDLTLAPGVSVLSGTWNVPDHASLTLDGSEAEFVLEAGAISIVSCGAPLIFDTIRGDGALFSAPAGTGVQLDSVSTGEGYLDIAASGGSIVLRADAATRITLKIRTESEHAAVCAATQCWGLAERTKTFDPDGGIEPCIITICWGK